MTNTPETPEITTPEKPTPAQKTHVIRVSARVVWWSAAVLTASFVLVAAGIGYVERDLIALLFLGLGGLCWIVGQAAIAAITRRQTSAG